MKEMNDHLISEQEKTMEELIHNNKGFFEQFKTEEYSSNLKKEIKMKQSFGNKDKNFKKTLAEKWTDLRLA